ncbi:MAG: MazG family protein [Lachnospiraceae bacterium]|nr:MazG family protein [Lachnospiraceae bacterium]
MENNEKEIQYSFKDLIEIVETLRGENGCPWDKKQTHDSLRPYIMEEAAELVSSIRIYNRTGNAENLKEELGDILLQVVMHAQIAGEEGLFTLEEVIDGISAKMVRRHPHVFGRANTGEEQIREEWEEIKRKEKEGKEWIVSPLREIPTELPGLTRAAKVIKKADKLYGTGISYDKEVQSLEILVEKLKEIKLPEADSALGELMSEMLMKLCTIAGRYSVPQEQLLIDKIEDMIAVCEPLDE